VFTGCFLISFYIVEIYQNTFPFLSTLQAAHGTPSYAFVHHGLQVGRFPLSVVCLASRHTNLGHCVTLTSTIRLKVRLEVVATAHDILNTVT
jgi:hypothetical protein